MDWHAPRRPRWPMPTACFRRDGNRASFFQLGSSLRRKNRDGILRVFARLVDKADLQLVFAGKTLDSSQRKLAAELNVLDRVVETGEISNEQLRALYSSALVFFF